jgi:F-box and WD-40 domain protein CDC4
MVHEFLGHAEPVRAVLMPNKDTVVSSTNQGVIRVWDVSSRHCRHELTGHEGDIPCLAVHGNILISGSSDSSVRVWDIQTGHCMQVLEGHDASFGILGFNQDSTLLAAGGIGGALEVWRLHDGLV